MPLIIDGERIRTLVGIKEFIRAYPQFHDETKRLKSMPAIAVDPQEPYLFIHQMECACISVDDPGVQMLGLDDMTTCCSVIIRHTGSKSLGAGHFDGNDTKEGLRRIINGVAEITTDWARQNSISHTDLNERYRYEIHLIGGFEDGRGISLDVITQLIECLSETNFELHLKTMCIFDSNTYYRDGIPLPSIIGLICDARTGQILPASFSFQGPLEEIRRLRFSMRPPMIMNLVYSSITRILEIKPYEWTMTNDTIEQLMGLNTNSFLHYLSTSPLAEKPTYVPSCKAALKFLKDNRNSLFCSGRSYKFIRYDDHWKLVE